MKPLARSVAGTLGLAIALGLGPLTELRAQSQTAQTIRYGEVVDVSKTVVVDKPTGTGATVGATAGAVAGYAIVGGRDRWLGGLLGGVLGGAAGKAAERAGKKRKGFTLIIKLDNGEEIGIDVVGKKQQHQVGDRVRLMTSPDGKTKVSVIES